MKTMARWLIGLKNDVMSAQKTFRMLTAFIQSRGDPVGGGRMGKIEMGWLRLAAGTAMLKICEQKGVGDQFTVEQFYALSLLIADDIPEVRERFAAKLHRGLYRMPLRSLPLDFMGVYALAGTEEDRRIRGRCRNFKALFLAESLMFCVFSYYPTLDVGRHRETARLPEGPANVGEHGAHGRQAALHFARLHARLRRSNPCARPGVHEREEHGTAAAHPPVSVVRARAADEQARELLLRLLQGAHRAHEEPPRRVQAGRRGDEPQAVGRLRSGHGADHAENDKFRNEGLSHSASYSVNVFQVLESQVFPGCILTNVCVSTGRTKILILSTPRSTYRQNSRFHRLKKRRLSVLVG